MIESNLLGGAQDFPIQPFVYGRGLTDARPSWEQTLPVLANLAAAVRARREAGIPQSEGRSPLAGDGSTGAIARKRTLASD